MRSQHLAQLLVTPYNSHFPFHREETKAQWGEAICPRHTAWSRAARTPTQADRPGLCSDQQASVPVAGTVRLTGCGGSRQQVSEHGALCLES